MIANVTGSATSATNDGNGNVISSTYGKLGANNVWTGNQYYTGMVILNSSSDVAEQQVNKLPKDVTTSSDALVRFTTLKDSEGHYVVINSEGHWASYAAKATTLKYKNDSTKTGTVEFRINSNGSGLIYPLSPFECDLGNIGNPWRTVCAGNYFCWAEIPAYYLIDTVLEKGVQPTSNRASYSGYWQDKNNVVMGYSRFVEYDNGAQTYEMHIRNNVTNGTLDPSGTQIAGGLQLALFPSSSSSSVVAHTSNVIPGTTNVTDLGTSSNQWRKIYGRDYYYNGTQWGLDQANVWTNTNTFNQNIVYQRTNFFHRGVSPCYYLDDIVLEKGVAPTEDHAAYTGYWRDKDGAEMGRARFVQYANNDNAQTFELGVYNLQSNGALSKTGSDCSAQLFLKLYPKIKASEFVICANVLTPGYPGISTLGTLTYKWKAINGLNPGSLSLPDNTRGEPIDTNGWNLDYASNNYYPPEDGWLYIATTADFIQLDGSAGWGQTSAKGSDGFCECFIPVIKGVETQIRIKNATSVRTATFFPSKGDPTFTPTP